MGLFISLKLFVLLLINVPGSLLQESHESSGPLVYRENAGGSKLFRFRADVHSVTCRCLSS